MTCCHDDSGLLNRRQVLQAAVLGLAASALARPDWAAAAGRQAESVAEIDAFEGILTARSSDAIEIKLADELRTVPIGDAARYWKGAESSAAALSDGDNVLVRTVNGKIDYIWANLVSVEGSVAQSTKTGSLIVSSTDASAVEVVINGRTRFESALEGTFSASESLLPGTHVHVSGLDLGGYVAASLVTFSLGEAKRSAKARSGPERVQRVKDRDRAPLAILTYTGIASYFICGTGAGRCGQCNTSNSAQCAWPAWDSCGCCTSTCCDCSRGCKNQDRRAGRCGKLVTVHDLCADRARNITIVDCGPCQSTACAQCTVVCGHRSTCGSISRVAAIVDLTRPTFVAFGYNPTTRSSFPCNATVTV